MTGTTTARWTSSPETRGGSDNWGLVKRLVRQESGSGGDFGASVSADGGTVMVGTPWYDPDGGIGSVHVWEP